MSGRRPVSGVGQTAIRLAGATLLAEEIARIWVVLRAWAADTMPATPAAWRPDIALMAGEDVRRIAWLVEHDADARRYWTVLERILAEREALLVGRDGQGGSP
jgi:hypothetical protein